MTTANISTPLPAGLDEKKVIAALHNHDLMIKLHCASLVSCERESGDPSSTATYKVTDKRAVGNTSFTITLTNVDDGVDTAVDAGASIGALNIVSKWRVAGGVLKEDVEIDGNLVTKKIGKGNVDKAHPEMQKKLIEEATNA